MYAFGGCGLSLITDLISTALGDFHAFFDPYIYYDDEELRKIVDTLVGACVFSAQEKVQGSRKMMLVHLWKKMMTGEGLRSRLPYAILTRMVSLIGWVRMEVNSLLSFADMSEKEFESILRR